MKQVTIIYRNCNNPNAINFIKNNLEEVFGEYIAFSNCYLCDVKPEEKLKADAFLALGEDIFQRVKESGYVDDFSKIIKMNRSPDRIALNKISEIPLNTNVLIVNDSYESSLDTTYSFYEAGIGHINMIPYDSALEHTGIYDKIEIAITPAEAHLVPVQIKEIIDIGYRKVSFDTMFKLMKMLDLDIGIINRNLFRHIHSVVESNTAFHANYVYGYLKSEMLSHMASSSKIGMILVDQFFQIVYANDKAIQIFQEDDKNKIQIEKYIDPAILSSDDAQNMPINILNSNYYYDRFAITLMDEIAGYYITLQDEADVALSNNTLRQKGFFAKHQFRDIIHTSADMDKAIDIARQIALTNHTVLIRGESGTGKELMAQSIHNASYRNKFPFVAVNCAALPDNLLESELFGYEAGAFTGAHTKGKVGLFEQANHGTIFLDEIGDISPKLQSRLLRTIQEHQIMRVGSDRMIEIDVRFITATNRNLEQAVREGTFRSDLFFRLNVLPVVIPPLRKRKDDILVLLQYFLGGDFKNITAQDLTLLSKYDWPGNIRELENVATYYKTLLSLP
ncbi:MAG: sigma-54 interaction domain-containing protein, partial [Emergencia timonensis]